MGTYRITVERPAAPAYEGSFTFEDDAVPSATFTTDCYWDPDKRIPGRTYDGCSLTTMATKKRDGIFIPGVQGFTGVFIHKGEHLPSLKWIKIWSDACVLVEPGIMTQLAERIRPRDGRNVTVIVKEM